MENLTVVSPFTNITRIEYQGQLVLTTAQLAQFYETTHETIWQNFRRNQDRFVEEKHMFTLHGLELRNFRVEMEKLYLTDCQVQISPMARTFYLWTRRGAARHAKMLTTDRAWEVFEMLEDAYFNPPKPQKKSQHVLALELQRARELRRLADRTDDPNERERLIDEATKILSSSPR